MTHCPPDVCASVICVGFTDSLHTVAASTGGPVDGVLLVPVLPDNPDASWHRLFFSFLSCSAAAGFICNCAGRVAGARGRVTHVPWFTLLMRFSLRGLAQRGATLISSNDVSRHQQHMMGAAHVRSPLKLLGGSLMMTRSTTSAMSRLMMCCPVLGNGRGLLPSSRKTVTGLLLFTSCYQLKTVSTQ